MTSLKAPLSRSDLNNAKEVAVRIFQDDEISARAVPPRIAFGSQCDQSLYFDFLFGGVQVQVQSTSADAGLQRVVQQHIGDCPFGSRSTTQPAVAGSLGV